MTPDLGHAGEAGPVGPVGVYRNRKTGLPYLALGRAEDQTNATAGRRLVLYVGVSPAPGGQLFARDEAEFLDKFEPAAAPGAL